MNARKDGGACLRHGASRHTNFMHHEERDEVWGPGLTPPFCNYLAGPPYEIHDPSRTQECPRPPQHR